MSEKVEALFVVLEQTSSEELDRSAQAIAAREKHDVAQFVAHIAEIAARNYHLALGYANLFQYCVGRFNLSEGSVYRRTQVAGVCRRFPQILEAISEGRLHLTGASMIAPHLTEHNVARLIAMAENATRRELEKQLVELAPKKVFVPSLRPQTTRGGAVSVPSLAAPQSGASGMSSTQLEAAARAGCGAHSDTVAPGMSAVQSNTAAQGMSTAHSEAAAHGMGAAQPGVSDEAPRVMTPPSFPEKGHTRDLFEPATVDRYNFRFSAGSEFAAKFMRLAEVLGIAHPRNHIEDVLSRALDMALEKKDPQRRLERRRQRQARKDPPFPDEGEQCDDAFPRGESSGCSEQVLEAHPAMGVTPVGATRCGVPLHSAACRGVGVCDVAACDVAGSELPVNDAAARDTAGSEAAASDVAARDKAVRDVAVRDVAVRDAAVDAPTACVAAACEVPVRSGPSRHVPAQVRDRVLERAGYQCEYRGTEGQRCTCRTALQVEHTLPFAVYHTHAEESLKVYCAAHNRHAAREFYGSAFIEQKIEAARRARAERVEQGVAV